VALLRAQIPHADNGLNPDVNPNIIQDEEELRRHQEVGPAQGPADEI